MMINSKIRASIYKGLNYPILAQKKYSFSPLRCVIILCLMTGLSYSSFAQSNEGVIHYKVISNDVKKYQAFANYDKLKIEKESYLYPGENFISYTNLYFNTRETRYLEVTENESTQDPSAFSTSLNFLDKTLSIVTSIVGKNYIIKDSLRFPEWIIMNDIKEIAGHICMSASMVDTIRNQKVLAWFATDFPISGGPERWYGLPGMILEVDVNNGAMIVSADKIELFKLTTQLNKPKKIKGTNVTQKKYNEIFRKYFIRCRELSTPYYNKARY